MSMLELTSVNVDNVFRGCLYADNELPVDGSVPGDCVRVKGVMMNVGFNPVRLAAHSEEIVDLLSQLPKEFYSSETSGGGWSFLNACMDSHGAQWGEHRDVDALYMLGQAIGVVKVLLPREMWSALPGGMPYFSVNAGSVDQPPAPADGKDEAR